MAQRDNILQELNDLQSPLAGYPAGHPYTAPAGYFDSLAEDVMKCIKATEADDHPGKELAFLSPLLSNAPRNNPYLAPVGYFDHLAQDLLFAVQHPDKPQTAQEELTSLSPLLGGLKKETPFSVPSNYFDTLSPSGAGTEQENTPEARIISIANRKWFRYAAAAVIVFFVATGIFLFSNKKETIDPQVNSYAWIKSNLKKVSTEDLDEFIHITEEATAVAVNSSGSDDIKELMKNVSDKEIQEFLKDADPGETDTDDDLLLN